MSVCDEPAKRVKDLSSEETFDVLSKAYKCNNDQEVLEEDCYLDKVNESIQDASGSDGEDDNASLEVNYGGESCHASDVSSLSFQNILFDDIENDCDSLTNNQRDTNSLKDSLSESSNSPMHDFLSEIEDHVYRRDFEKDMSSRVNVRNITKDFHFDSVNENSTIKKQNSSLSKASNGAPYLYKQPLIFPSYASNTNRGGGGGFTNMNLFNDAQTSGGSDFQRVSVDKSEAGVDNGEACEIGNCGREDMQAKVLASFGAVHDSTMSDLRTIIASNSSKQHAKPTGESVNGTHVGVNEGGKHARRVRGAPGLPLRQRDAYRDDSSSERELDTSEGLDMRLKPPLSSHSKPPAAPQSKSSTKGIIENVQLDERINKTMSNLNIDNISVSRRTVEKSLPPPSLNELIQKEREMSASPLELQVENEYDYVKYARVQNGNSVGMRLAMSDSNDLLTKEATGTGGKNPNLLKNQTSSATDKIDVDLLANTQSESEIVDVNGLNDSSVEQKNVSMSPENTECDSTEVESVLSEEGRSVAMPHVLDGLSSGHASEAEDLPVSSAHALSGFLQGARDEQAPAEGSDAQDALGDSSVRRFFNHSESSQEQSPTKQHALEQRKKALDLAIKDIQSALQQKRTVLHSPSHSPAHSEQPPDDPVWVMRESYVRRREGEVRSAREQAERRRHEQHETMPESGLEDEIARPLDLQYSHSDAKSSHKPKGLDRDDDYSESDAGARRRGHQAPHESPVPGGAVNYTHSSHRGNGTLFKKSSSQGDLHMQRSPGYKPPHNRFSDSLSHSRYRRQGAMEHAQSQEVVGREDRARILQSYGYASPHASHESSPARSEYDNMPGEDEHVPGCPLHRHAHQRLHAQHAHSPVPHQHAQHADLDDEYNEGQPSVYIKGKEPADYDTDEETDELLDKQYEKRERPVHIPELSHSQSQPKQTEEVRASRVREGETEESLTLRHPDDDTVLIEGVLFRARYLGSTTLISEGTPSKSMRMMQAQEAVGRIKAPEGENQPSTDVDLFVSTEKIMVLNTNLQEILMDHSLRTISYIADIGDIVVIMARRGPVHCPPDSLGRTKRQAKICCHVFETDEAQLIAQSIGQAFQVAYMEFLKANGIEDQGLIKEMDYQEVLNQQEIFGEELTLFSNKETQKEVLVRKLKGEALNIVVVESGWGSMVPTVVLANMSPNGAAARCGQLNIGDQIMTVNGTSLVGLPLSSCQNYIKAAKAQTLVKLNVVSCAPVVEVCIKRPDVKYQLGFSVQNGVICSLLRGGIAERGGVRVGHRIIEINSHSVVAVPHEKIVTMLATAVGEIHMKTMPTSIYRLLTGQETPHYI